MNIQERQKGWEESFKNNKAGNIYIAYDNDKAIGFIGFGLARDKDKDGCGEIYLIYSLKEAWGKAIGHALFETAKRKFQDKGINAAYLWTLDTNERAIKSYKSWGGIVDYTTVRNRKIEGQETREVMVTFRF